MSRMLQTKLLLLSTTDYWCVSDAVRHAFISGDSGSGKTSGSGAEIQNALQKSGAGALYLIAKPDETASVIRLARRTGRKKSVIVVNATNGECFNFLQYELSRQGSDGIGSVVECLLSVVEASRIASGANGKASDQFWEQTTRMLLRHSLPVIHAATRTVTIPSIIEFVRTAPRSTDELHDEEWQRRSPFYRTLMEAERHLSPDVGEKIISYWLNEFCALDPKTRANIVASLTTTLDRFNHGWMQRLFCGETTFTPELCYSGAIIILDLPALTLNEDGIIAQILFKFIWQRAMLARNALPKAQRERLVYLWIDEYQLFASSFDFTFLSACRSSMVACVLLTQSLPTLHASLSSGEDGRAKADALLSLCATKIIHSTSCTVTAKWAADMIGRSMHRRASYSTGDSYSENHGTSVGMGDNWGESAGSQSSWGGSHQTSGANGSSGTNWGGGSNRGTTSGGSRNVGRSSGVTRGQSESHSWAEQLDHAIEPADLGRMLRTGGRANRSMVDGIFYMSGRVFAESGTNWLLASFRQAR